MKDIKIVMVGTSHAAILPAGEWLMLGKPTKARITLKQDKTGPYWVVRPVTKVRL